jgi:hypothetical protein
MLAPRKSRIRHRWCQSACSGHLHIVLCTASQHRSHVECGMRHGHGCLACPLSKFKLMISTRGDNISPQCACTASVCLRDGYKAQMSAFISASHAQSPACLSPYHYASVISIVTNMGFGSSLLLQRQNTAHAHSPHRGDCLHRTSHPHPTLSPAFINCFRPT